MVEPSFSSFELQTSVQFCVVAEEDMCKAAVSASRDGKERSVTWHQMNVKWAIAVDMENVLVALVSALLAFAEPIAISVCTTFLQCLPLWHVYLDENLRPICLTFQSFIICRNANIDEFFLIFDFRCHLLTRHILYLQTDLLARHLPQPAIKV